METLPSASGTVGPQPWEAGRGRGVADGGGPRTNVYLASCVRFCNSFPMETEDRVETVLL